MQTLGTPIHSELEMPYAISCEYALEYFHLKSAEKLEHLAFLYKKGECKHVCIVFSKFRRPIKVN